MDVLNSSIQELENNYWTDLKDYPTSLVENCHRLRKVKIKDLAIHDIIELLIQDIGSEYLMPIVLEKMEKDVAEEDNHDGSSFIESIDFFSDDIFTRNPKLLLDTLDVFKRKQPEIENVIGWKRYERIVRKFEEKTPAHNNH